MESSSKPRAFPTPVSLFRLSHRGATGQSRRKQKTNEPLHDPSQSMECAPAAARKIVQHACKVMIIIGLLEYAATFRAWSQAKAALAVIAREVAGNLLCAVGRQETCASRLQEHLVWTEASHHHVDVSEASFFDLFDAHTCHEI